MTARLSETLDAMALAVREGLARNAAERHRRRMVHLIDAALDRCEVRNLRGRGHGQVDADPAVVALIEWLQLEAGEDVWLPGSNQQALDELFRLQVAYLLAPRDEEEDEEAVVAVFARARLP